MKKVQYYSGDSFEFHKKVVATKRASDKKNILQSLETDIEQSYKMYNNNFANNTLSVLKPMVTTSQNKELLKGLYQFKRKAFTDLFVSLTTTKGNSRDMLCPNCTLMDCSQLDHYIPKSLFPEFSANSRNLIQCCSICNQKKLDRWLKGGKPIFLNLYLDDLPQEQYLFVDIKMDKSIPKVNFYLQNTGRIDTTLFSRIESHYKELDLLKRFAEKADSVISEILRDYTATAEARVKPSQFWEILTSRAKLDQQEFGFNYWKSILTLGCCSNRDFCKYIETEKAVP